MTEEELRGRLNKKLCAVAPWTPLLADQIIDLFREAGWKSPEEVEQIEDDVHAMYNDD